VRTYVPELPENWERASPLATCFVTSAESGISGSSSQWPDGGVSDDVIRLEDVIHFVKRMKALNFTPRDRYLYSNTGYTLAGLIVEKVSGRPLADFARDNIFSPLGMANTRFSPRPTA